MRMVLLLLAAGLAVAPARSETPQLAPTRQLWVIDGDTVDVPRPDDAGTKERLRLLDIDAPETHRPECEAERRAGEAAKAETIRLLRAGRTAAITRAGLDPYGRRLGRIAIDGRDLGEALLAGGHALPYRPGPADRARRHAIWCGR